tara:strand:+ start:3003 stop:3812 length:810 start_codon:yes stop_codon:yes gene_type:complete
MSIEQQMNNQTTDQVNNQASYMTMGTGKNLVLVHGWGVSSAIWKPVAKQLSEHYCVHLVDLPGFGAAPEISNYSLASIADTILQKLPTNAVWCGWSLGGLIATYIANHYPNRVEKLIQVCAPLKFVEQDDWLGVKKEVFERFKVGVIKQPKKTLNRFFSLQAMGSKTVKNDIMTINKLLIGQPEPKQAALIAGLDLLNNVDLREQFKQLTMPCLSLFGESDILVPVANIAILAKLVVSNQQVIFKDSSHAPFISEPEHFQAVLIDFINR